MKRSFLFDTALLLAVAAGAVSCGDTWLKYDTSQKNKLYFTCLLYTSPSPRD